jgi:hypothetical protein
MRVEPWHLDDVARVAGGNTPMRPVAEREQTVTRIIATPTWITEGIDLGWTDPLLREADLIVWLDHVSWRTARRRVVTRFVSNAVAEARRQRGLKRFLRFGDYARHLRELVHAMPDTRDYYAGGQAGEDVPSVPTRAATEAVLRPYGHKVVRCRTAADIRTVLQNVEKGANRDAQYPQMADTFLPRTASSRRTSDRNSP